MRQARQLFDWINKKSKSRSEWSGRRSRRNGRFEKLEDRHLLNADPVVIGATYWEGDQGADSQPDEILVSYEGGTSRTQLTQFVINGDKDGSGTVSQSDMVFDVAPGLPGEGFFADFAFLESKSLGVTADDIRGVSVSDDGLTLTVDVENFHSGDVFAFSIDVDEVEGLIHDPIASAAEFEGTTITGTLVDPEYTFEQTEFSVDVVLQNGLQQHQVSGQFYDQFTDYFEEAAQVAGQSLELPLDDTAAQSSRRAGGVVAYDAIARPISISGTVFNDMDQDCVHGPDEVGVEGIEIELWLRNESSGILERVASTNTDSDGNYVFDESLGLFNGEYRIVQNLKDGYFNTGANVGNINGELAGDVIDSITSEPGSIQLIIDENGAVAEDYDFKVVEPVTISGQVFNDANSSGMREAGESGIGNVAIRAERINGLSPDDHFAGFEPVVVLTDSNGHYRIEGLPPGVYNLYEVNDYGNDPNPLAGFLDGVDVAGTIDGVTTGLARNDLVESIQLQGGQHAIQYDFAEYQPVVFSGTVFDDANQDCIHNSDEAGVAGIKIHLEKQDEATGQYIRVASRISDDQGDYRFGEDLELTLGTYRLVQETSAGWFNTGGLPGTIDGDHVGQLIHPGTEQDTSIEEILATNNGQSGERYDFKVVAPVSISGSVYNDLNRDGEFQPEEHGIEHVAITAIRTGPPIGIAEDPFTGFQEVSVQTDSNGGYRFEGLPPGTYQVVEVNDYFNSNPLDGFLDGIDSAGLIDGAVVGTAGNDIIRTISLTSGQHGVQYNFGEYQPVAVSGTVYHDADLDCEHDEDEVGLAGVSIRLEILDSESGTWSSIASTQTDSAGDYSFSVDLDLPLGTYRLVQESVDGFWNLGGKSGQINGEPVGTAALTEPTQNAVIDSIVISDSNLQGVNFDFKLVQPTMLEGYVYVDANDDGIRGAGETGIENVAVQIVRRVEGPHDPFASFEPILVTTNVDGNYKFRGLPPGVYDLVEINQYPPGQNPLEDLLDGKDSAGEVNGIVVGDVDNDQILGIRLRSGQSGNEFNFGELRPSAISGQVHTSIGGDCTDPDATHQPVAGVAISLVNDQDQLVESTFTDQTGRYHFSNLLPGVYRVVQQQPEGLFQGTQSVGNRVGQIEVGSGDATVSDRISVINIGQGEVLENYDFCELAPAVVSGVVYQDGAGFTTESGELPDNYRQILNGLFDAGFDQPIPGTTIEIWRMPDNGGVRLVPVLESELIGNQTVGLQTLAGSIANSGNGETLTTTTDVNGRYLFEGLPPGNYVLVQRQPDGYLDANDSTGIQTAQVANDVDQISRLPEAVVQTLPTARLLDVIAGVQLNSGDFFTNNNFGETLVDARPEPDDPRRPQDPIRVAPDTGIPGNPGFVPSSLASATSPGTQQIVFSNGLLPIFQPVEGAIPWTWHLTIINGGEPGNFGTESSIVNANSLLEAYQWSPERLADGRFEILDDEKRTEFQFGPLLGKPVALDFNGDGVDEVAVFLDGYWWIDVNGNWAWDEGDVVAKLGDSLDQPVAGDWDRDGNEDIGIYGPIWNGDRVAIQVDAGLPDKSNIQFLHSAWAGRPTGELVDGDCKLKCGLDKPVYRDVVDHVFGYGDSEDIAFVGDFNGDGVDTIGLFRDGKWHIDSNGDGRLTASDRFAEFGAVDSLPVVGDFDGDGRDEIGFFKSGHWHVDSNRNMELDAKDIVFALGDEYDLPLTGDFDGDGIDEIAVYRNR